MKKLLANIGLSLGVVIVGVVLLVMACVVACLVGVWQIPPAPTSAAGESPRDSAAPPTGTEFDGPPWALGRYRTRRGGAVSYERQYRWLSIAAAEFDRVGPARTRFPAGALLCRVSMERVAWDPLVTPGSSDPVFGGIAPPETSATLRVGNAPFRDAHGPEDQHEVTFAFPLTALPDGVTITLRAYDRDLSAHDEAGEVTIRYDGHLPIRFTGARFSAECRGASPERVSALAEPAIGELDALLGRFEFPPMQSAFEAPRNGDNLWDANARFARIQWGIFSLADWLGWSHPTMTRLVSAAEAAPRELPRHIASALGALPRTPNARIGDIGLRLLRWHCGAAARGRCGVSDDQGCVAELALGRFDDTQVEPIVRENADLFSPVAKRSATRFEALPGRREYCLAFDASGAPTLLDGSAPAVLLLRNLTAPLRVQ